ncbi:MAG: dihydropteroate synthase [Candidatus Bipolaricaulis sp.]|nr:dihydropteroate synthase [Candidatus Bipolaricaulis sp.]MDD5645696.1 dihydropteroate synthase [Candidatus Bipolaricaulis sp.]
MLDLEQWIVRRDRVLVVGILNATPDSFFERSRAPSPSAAVERALRMVEDGADIIDVGGESSRPGSAPVPEEEETARVIPILEGIRRRTDVLLSVDTTKAAVAAEALRAGASMVNDISALRFDPEMAAVVADREAFVVLMHMQGTPGTMQADPVYEDVVSEVHTFLGKRIVAATSAGVRRDRIVIDPGIGFGKRLAHNLELLRNIERFTDLGPPVLVGASRKSFLGEILGLPVEERLEGTLAVHAVAVARGADLIRVHDIKEGRRAADAARRLRRHAA